MSTTFEHSTLSDALTSGINTATLNAGAHFAGSEIDNTAGTYEAVDLEVLFQLAATAVAGDPIKLYIIYCEGGTTYEDGVPGTNDGTAAASPPPDPGRQVAVIGALADTSAHRITRNNIPIGPYKFKIVVYNGTTKNLATSNFVVNARGRKRQTVG